MRGPRGPPPIAQHRSGISAICQRYGIRRLEVFGWAARADDFDPERSDADFLVEFAPGVQANINRNRASIFSNRFSYLFNSYLRNIYNRHRPV